MNGNNIIFNDKKINKNSFYRNKKLYNIDDIDVNKILISKKEPYGKKAHLNILLDMMIMTTLDRLIVCFIVNNIYIKITK